MPPKSPQAQAQVADDAFPQKLAPGSGQKVTLTSNHFELTPGDKTIYRYDVSIVQVIPDPNKERADRVIDWCTNTGDSVKRNERHSVNLRLLHEAVQKEKFATRTTVVVYDNSKTLFGSEKLDAQGKRLEFTFEGEQLPADFLEDSRLKRGKFTLSITPTETGHTFQGNDLKKAVQRNQEDHSLRQFWEILTNQNAVTEMTHTVFCGTLYEINPTPQRQRQLKDSCHIVFGITKGTRIIGDNLDSMKAAVVLDSQKAVFYDESSQESHGLVGNVRALLGRDKEQLNKSDKIQIEKFLKNVTLCHLYTNQEFKFTRLDEQRISAAKFTDREGREISVVEYHQQKFGSKGFLMVKPNWFGVIREIHRDRKAIVYPLEVLGIKEGQQVSNSRLTANHTKALLKEAKDPKQRFDEIQDSLKVLNLVGEGNEYLREHGVSISAEPMEVEGHIRELPSLSYGSKEVVKPNKWSTKWKTEGKFLVPAAVSKFILLYNADSITTKELEGFKKAYLFECEKKGMRFPNVVVTPVKAISEVSKILEEQKKEKLPFVMFIDSAQSKTHEELKYKEIMTQVLTQQVTSEIVKEHFKKETMANIVAKNNQKCFGQNYKVKFNSKFISTSDTLIIAYDVAHPTGTSAPSASSRKTSIPDVMPSVVGISFNGAKNPDSFIGDYAFQEPRKELVGTLRKSVPWMLEMFMKNRGIRPTRIAVIRDGVSEGQFRMVRDEEVEDIRRGCSDFKPGYKPKLLVLTVTKRHEKRFFSMKKADTEAPAKQGRGSGRAPAKQAPDQHGRIPVNPTPGTVIDRTVTRPDMTEFFIQPHSVPQGTAKMPAYSLLLNEFENPPNNTTDWLADFLIGLCCSHQIISSAVSIPEPVYQADEWAKRGFANFRYLKNNVLNEKNRRLIARFVVDVPDPKNPGSTMKTFKWDEITEHLQYRGTKLEGTRANA